MIGGTDSKGCNTSTEDPVDEPISFLTHLKLENSKCKYLVLFKDPAKVEWARLSDDHFLVKQYVQPEETENIDVLEGDALEEWLA